MKLFEKVGYLQKEHWSEWFDAMQKTRQELSEKNETFCVCGRLATGLHESHCRKLSKKVVSETVKKLKHLIKK